ncbi:hypothetical protein EVAR_18462_1 [Eumeta japonica]|uniref:Uncharacterized protein n=1 Tax=Eumeta variegata TaxID=151549 RepID=A0A4C1UZJ4_EUMVA|nr:hypothetical protein EVAR_18462_1 [Eumeta japonica]
MLTGDCRGSVRIATGVLTTNSATPTEYINDVSHINMQDMKLIKAGLSAGYDRDGSKTLKGGGDIISNPLY